MATTFDPSTHLPNQAGLHQRITEALTYQWQHLPGQVGGGTIWWVFQSSH